MDILEVIADPSLSGGPKHVLTLVKQLSNTFKIATVCPRGYLSQELESASLDCKTINLKSIFDLGSISSLRAYIKGFHPKLVHAHGVRAGIITYFAILFIHVSFIYSEHLYTSEYHLENPMREFFQLTLLGLVCRRAKKIIVPSQCVKSFLLKRFSLGEAKIIVVANGVDDFKVVHREGTIATIGFIGGSGRTKGLPLLLSAVRQINADAQKVKLQVLGEVNTDFKHYQDVELLGSVKDISEPMGSWRALVVPSTTESFGQVVLEAAVASLPVVATKAGALPEIVKDNYNGLLVGKNDLNGLVGAISKILADKNLAKKMGENNRKLYERKFTSKTMSSQIGEVYAKIMSDENK